MLLYLTEYLARSYSGFHVFQYLTLRGILAAMTALAIAMFIGPRMISALSRYQIGQQVRTDGPQSHLQKSGTPTMGGGLILVAMVIAHPAVGGSVQPLRLDAARRDARVRRHRLLRRLFETGGAAIPRACRRATSIWRSRWPRCASAFSLHAIASVAGRDLAVRAVLQDRGGADVHRRIRRLSPTSSSSAPATP